MIIWHRCATCGVEFSGRKNRLCPLCYKQKELAAKRAHVKVQKAVKKDKLVALDGSIPCVDCGAPAVAYDHRDYRFALHVEPVCTKCNVRRGSADFDFEKHQMERLRHVKSFMEIGKSPQECVQKLISSGWNLSNIGREVGLHKANVMRIYRGTQEPTWTNGEKIIELARLVSGEKGRK